MPVVLLGTSNFRGEQKCGQLVVTGYTSVRFIQELRRGTLPSLRLQPARRKQTIARWMREGKNEH